MLIFWDGKPQLQISYDPVTQLITSQTDMTGKTTFTYDDDGLIRQQVHVGKNSYPDYQFRWRYDTNRRIVSVTDIKANQTEKIYDELGRTAQVRYQPYHGKSEPLSVPVYDDFSRTVAIKYGSGMYRKIHYDSMGHPDIITDRLNDQPLSYWSFNYDPLDNITMQLYKSEDNQAVYHYQYDALNNLVKMTCGGMNQNALCPRDTAFKASGIESAPVIIRQKYTFTRLNRLASVEEILQDKLQQQTLSKLTTYHYTDHTAPLRLQQISTSWNHFPQITQQFHYDIMGNMTTDGEGNHIVYNAYNQVIKVTQFNGQQSDYLYDGLGKETLERNVQGVSYLIYRGNHLVNEKISSPGQTEHITGYQGIVKTIDGRIYQYNESNYRGDVVSILTKPEQNDHNYKLQRINIYSPYGMVWHQKTQGVPLYQRSLSGFDGERTDPATGWQFLGAGNRTYNPKQRYFVSEDPAGGGYAFGSNNPVMNRDPTGNVPQWVGTAFKWAGYVSSFGLSALHARWANIAGAVINAGLTIATLGASAYSYGGALPGLAVTAGAALAGSVPVTAASIPANKGLNIAGSVVGIVQTAAMIATAAIDAGLFFTKKIPLSMTKMLINRGDADLKDPNVQMFKTIIFKRKRLFISRFDIKEFIGRSSFIALRHGYVSVDFDYIAYLWLRFSSENNDIIACDTACILALMGFKKIYIKIDILQMFFDAKYAFMKSITESQLYLMNSMVKAVPDKYLKVLDVILDKIPGEYKVHTDEQNISLENILLPRDTCFVFVPGHVQFVQRVYDDYWATYEFASAEVNTRIGRLDSIEQSIFANIDSPYQRKILACKIFTREENIFVD